MVCMIADYKENGIDRHNEYIISGTSDYEKAVKLLPACWSIKAFLYRVSLFAQTQRVLQICAIWRAKG